MYRAIKFFTDLQDNEYAYHPGDEFPRVGLEVSEMRLRELSTSANRRAEPLIAEYKEFAKPVEAVEPVQEEAKPKATPKKRRKKDVD